MIAAYMFFAFVVILLVIYQWASMESKEGFNTHQVHLPTTIPVAPVLTGEIQPASLPGPLPVAPYQQIASMSPLPYQDTTQIKANRQQLMSLLEMLKGFLAFEAQQLSERSDPTIQLPLQTARSDFQELQSQVSVLNRNPGIQPTITMKHMNDISSNLAFLQQQVRLIGSAGALQGPINQFTEGFANVPRSRVTATGAATRASTGAATSAATRAATRSATGAASIAELKNAMSRIQGEIVRLSASGTSDPLIQKRVATLTNIKNDINTIVDQVTANTLTASEIPIKSSDVKKMLPMLGNMSQPLPQLIQKNRLPQGLGNLLPRSAQQDPETMRQINRLVDRYADQIVKGVSASFTVRYEPPKDCVASKGPKGTPASKPSKGGSTVDRTGFPSLFDLDSASQKQFMPYDSGAPVTDHMAPTPQEAGRGPSQFDWKQRTKEIEDQVRKRGIRPEDVGMMPANTKVSPDFSWKGYARMICTRLQATMDPALPVTCGCPPMDWKGWRIAA
jgi:hypothetical protein